MNLKHKKEAEQQGLRLLPDRAIDHGLSSNYKKYQCINCHSEDFFQPQHVRRGAISCKTCLMDQLVSEATTAGYIYLGDAQEDHGKEQTYFRSYKNIACGCVSDIRYALIRNKTTQNCPLCYENTLIHTADSAGLIYLGHCEKQGIFRKFQYKQCGHTQEIAAPCISLGTFECKKCLDDKYNSEASQEGLILLRTSHCTKGYREYVLPCGCSRLLRIANVRNGTWSCTEHGETHLTRPSQIYLLKISNKENSWLKLGFSKDIEARVKMYGLPSDTSATLLFFENIKNGYDALQKEKQIHVKLKHIRLCPKKMKIYMKNGHTECYPCEYEEKILSLLKDEL